MKKKKLIRKEVLPYQDKLRIVRVDEVEEAISKAISKLTEEDYVVDIKSINFDPDEYSFRDQCEITLRLKKEIECDDNIPF